MSEKKPNRKLGLDETPYQGGYKEEFALIAGRVCQYYNSDDNGLAVIFGISKETLVEWKEKYSRLREMIDNHRDPYSRSSFACPRWQAEKLGQPYAGLLSRHGLSLEKQGKDDEAT